MRQVSHRVSTELSCVISNTAGPMVCSSAGAISDLTCVRRETHPWTCPISHPHMHRPSCPTVGHALTQHSQTQSLCRPKPLGQSKAAPSSALPTVKSPYTHRIFARHSLLPFLHYCPLTSRIRTKLNLAGRIAMYDDFTQRMRRSMHQKIQSLSEIVEEIVWCACIVQGGIGRLHSGLARHRQSCKSGPCRTSVLQSQDLRKCLL